MKSLLALIAFVFVAQSASAETVLLRPGERKQVYGTQVICGGGGSGGGGGGGWPPPQYGPTCELKGPGMYNGFKYNFRVAIDGNVVSAKDGLADALASAEQFRQQGLCRGTTREICNLRGPGMHNGFKYNFILAIGEENVVAKDGLADIISAAQSIGEKGFCRNQPAARCALQGAGMHNGFRYNFLIAIGNTVVAAKDGQTDALNVIQQLRDARLCY